MGITWTRYGGDKKNTCRHDVVASTSGIIRWALDLSDDDYFGLGSCTLTSSGNRLYIASEGYNPQSLYCIDTNSGIVLWRTIHDYRFDTGGSWASPVIGASGNIYVAYVNGIICKYEPNSGNLVWWSTCQQYSGEYDYIRNIIIGSGDVIYYVPNTRGGLAALNPNNWQCYVGEFSSFGRTYCGYVTYPAIDDSGYIYYGDADGRFIKVNPSGNIAWVVTSGSDIKVGSPSIGQMERSMLVATIKTLRHRTK